jgi:superfamily II DNA or RNA helicase
LADTPACLRQVPLQGRYRPRHRPHETFMLPMLQVAATFDRAAGYFRSSSLAIAAAGLERFVLDGGRIRLLVNHELTDEDRDAVLRGLDLRASVAAAVSKMPVVGGEGPSASALELLCTLVALEQLDVKVAVATDPDSGQPLTVDQARALYHSKFGVFTDRCDPPCQVAFEGSNNETTSGWLANRESFSTFASWIEDDWERHGRDVVEDFDAHWDGDPDPGWAVVDLPDAARDNLLARADTELLATGLDAQGRTEELERLLERVLAARGETADTPIDPLGDLADLLDAPVHQRGVGLATATVTPWLHQSDVARKVVAAWPASRMFSDEVGLGKTIEVGLVLRELLVSGRARRMLLLVPAAVQAQWQSELWEKFTLAIPSLEGSVLRWPEGSGPEGQERQAWTGNRWDAADVMLASSHLARRDEHRRDLIARRWDVVTVDEAHHARRRGLQANRDDPNALLQLLRRMRDAGCWDGLLLATATPMQMAAHEAYDLLSLLGLPGKADADNHEQRSWADAGAEGFVRYYEQLTVDEPHGRDWRLLRDLAASHFAVAPDADPNLLAAMEDRLSRRDMRAISRFHGALSDTTYRRMEPGTLAWLDVWLREHTPMRALVHRNTRHLLRAYDRAGLLPEGTVIPRRDVDEIPVRFSDVEQELYDRIETWIRDSYSAVAAAAAQGDKKAKAAGFIMTVYRRRLTSSFAAIEMSLAKRRDRLRQTRGGLLDLAALLSEDDRVATDEAAPELEGLEEALDATVEGSTVNEAVGAVDDELATLETFLRDLSTRPTFDAKLGKLIESLKAEMGQPKPDGQPRQAIVFTQFTDTMFALRDELASVWPGQACCYSGQGGQLHDPGSGSWRPISKAQLKERFAAGSFRLLLGTDAMSEGLNLQTCDLLYNLDLPWNFMRIEQRIGRIDRIGGHQTVHVRNLLVEGTVEERIYTGIKEDFGNFEHVVGAAQPVLAQTEQVIRDAAMSNPPDRDALLASRAQALIDAADESKAAPVNLDTFQQHADLVDHVNIWEAASPLDGEEPDWLATLEKRLTTHPVLGSRFHDRRDGTWLYSAESGTSWVVTFDRDVADDSAGEIGLFVWGHPAFPR